MFLLRLFLNCPVHYMHLGLSISCSPLPVPVASFSFSIDFPLSWCPYSHSNSKLTYFATFSRLRLSSCLATDSMDSRNKLFLVSILVFVLVYFSYFYFFDDAFRALTLLLGVRTVVRLIKNSLMRCLCGYVSGGRCRLFPYGPADATASQNPIISCLI